MQTLNVIGIESRGGFRTIELREGDLTALESPVDVLVLSAAAGRYTAKPETMIRALQDRSGIRVAEHADDPAVDLRQGLNFWASRELPETAPFRYLACVEILGAGVSLDEALDNLFAGLLVLEAKHIPIRTVAMPLLGAGSQGLPADELATALVSRARDYLERSSSTSRLVFVEIIPERARLVSDALDTLLGRERITLPRQQLVSALSQDVQRRIQQVDGLFEPGCEELRADWLRLLQQDEVRAVELGVQARKLVELFVQRLGARSGVLATRIRDLEKREILAPWVCAYMHVLRHIGNEAAHENLGGSTRRPLVVSPADLTAGLFCVQRLLDCWGELEPDGLSSDRPSI